MRRQGDEINGHSGEEEGHQASSEGRQPASEGHQPASMQAQRIQRIRGNYQGETRELPSGQDWPMSHSGVDDRLDKVEARDNLLEEMHGLSEGGGDV